MFLDQFLNAYGLHHPLLQQREVIVVPLIHHGFNDVKYLLFVGQVDHRLLVQLLTHSFVVLRVDDHLDHRLDQLRRVNDVD